MKLLQSLIVFSFLWVAHCVSEIPDEGAGSKIEPALSTEEQESSGEEGAEEASAQVPSSEGEEEAGTVRIIQLSSHKPRAYLFKGFLTAEECDHIINKSTPRLKRSMVANSKSGQGELSEVRTSSGTFMGKGEDEVIAAIEQRVSQWTFLPISHQEPLQVLKYEQGQQYEPHVDYFSDPVNKQRGGHRYATVLMYLNDVELGGETVFPEKDDPTPKDDTWTDCAKGYLAAKPRKGDAVLFFSMHPDGSPDPSSLHHACPVVKGVKWSAPMWIHVADYSKVYEVPVSAEAKGDGCSDLNGMCNTWAFNGECDKSKDYMSQACKKSCGLC